MSQSYITPVEDHDISVYLTYGGGVTKKEYVMCQSELPYPHIPMFALLEWKCDNVVDGSDVEVMMLNKFLYNFSETLYV